jgi:Tol biopolymer transport system component
LRGAGQLGLWVRELATNKDKQLIPPTDGAFTDFEFTPDDIYLYYNFSEGPIVVGHTALYRVPVTGGISEKLIDPFESDFKFSPDGKQLVFIRHDRSEGSGALVIANTDGTGERIIATRTAAESFVVTNHGPSWSHDGRMIAFAAVDANVGYERVFEVNIETGAQRPLTFRKWDTQIFDVVWLSDTRNLLIVAEYSLWRLSYASGELQKIAPDTGKYYALSATADSNLLVAAQGELNRSIWIAPGGEPDHARQITPSRGGGQGFGWMPDGRLVRVVAQPTGDSDICIINADGTNQKQLTANAGHNTLPTVTPDGRYIVFQSDRTGAYHIWRMDIDGGNQQQLTSGTSERSPRCSFDSKWVVYNAWESDQATAWKIPVDGGSPTQITDLECYNPAPSPDGSLIACNSGTAPPKKRLIISFAGGKLVEALDLPGGSGPPTWTLNGRATTYVNRERNIENIWIQPIDGSPPGQLTKVAPGETGNGIGLYAWSPDGSKLAFSSSEQLIDVVLIRDVR